MATTCLMAYALSGTPHAIAYLMILIGIFGGAAATVYPLAVAHAFDYVEREHMVAASAGMLLAWSIGATAGPLLASLIMSRSGDWALFLYLAGVSGLLAAFTRYRMGRRAALPSADQSKFAPRAEGSVAGELDPRARPVKA